MGKVYLIGYNNDIDYNNSGGRGIKIEIPKLNVDNKIGAEKISIYKIYPYGPLKWKDYYKVKVCLIIV